MRVWWRYHKVAPGETLASIARSYHTTALSISQANNLEDEDLQPDSKLIIPFAPGKHPAGEEAQSYSRMITRYKVRKGDTVQRVAYNFGVSPLMVRRWNHLKADSVQGRRILYIHLPVTPNASEAQTVASSKSKSKKHLHGGNQTLSRHEVKPGETLYSIANTHHTTVAALKRDNGNLAVLRPGMILVIHDVQ
jgi:membrane-bound lytic murein transglycosylase D